MTLDDVVDEVIRKSNEDAKSIKKEGKDEALEILKKAKSKAMKIEKKILDDASIVIEAMNKKETASTKLQAKRVELDAKKEVIDKVFDSMNERVQKLDEKTKNKIYDKMIKRAVYEMDVKYVYVNKNDINLIKSISKDFVVKEAEILGGIIIENKEQNVRIDNTFDSILEETRDDCLKEVSEILFKN